MDALYQLSYRGVPRLIVANYLRIAKYLLGRHVFVVLYAHMRACIYCGSLLSRHATKYCSNKCQSDFAYGAYIKRWKYGKEEGVRGIATKNMSGHLVRYVMEKYEDKCARCGWSKVNEFSGKTPLEIDHMDGNSENNNESNLILLCPNCHSLTSNYKNLNKGNGRLWRREKYVKIGKVPL